MHFNTDSYAGPFSSSPENRLNKNVHRTHPDARAHSVITLLADGADHVVIFRFGGFEVLIPVLRR